MKLILTAALMLIESQVARSQAGSLDNSFGTGGVVVTDFGLTTSHAFGNAVAIQNDGKILVAGTVLARLNSDGTPDNTFGNGGNATLPKLVGGEAIYGVAIVIQNDGKILVAGTRFALIRFHSNGTLDTDFGTNGLSGDMYYSDMGDWCHSMALQPDGKIMMAGTSGQRNDCRLSRWMSDGSQDFNFVDYGNAYYSVGPSNPAMGLYAKVYAHSVIATSRW